MKADKISKVDPRGVRCEASKEESSKIYNYLNSLLMKLTDEEEDIEYVEESVLRSSVKI